MDWIIFLVIGLAIWWIMSLCGILTTEFKQPSNKVIWVVLHFTLFPLSEILYAFIALKQIDEKPEERFKVRDNEKWSIK